MFKNIRNWTISNQDSYFICENNRIRLTDYPKGVQNFSYFIYEINLEKGETLMY